MTVLKLGSTIVLLAASKLSVPEMFNCPFRAVLPNSLDTLASSVVFKRPVFPSSFTTGLLSVISKYLRGVMGKLKFFRFLFNISLAHAHCAGT